MKAILERAVQRLYPLELPCESERVETQAQLNMNAQTFRSRQDAAMAARYHIEEISGETD